MLWESPKKSWVCLQKSWFSSNFLQTDDLSTNYWKTFKYSKKVSRFFYIAGREVEIHRGRLDKKILADRAQLFPRFLSKKIFKNFKNFRKTFSFFWMDIWKILENLGKISTFFVFDPSKMTLDFPSKMKKSRDFSKKSNPKKWKCFRKFLKFL